MENKKDDELSNIVCESIRDFSDECRKGGDVSEDKIKVFRAMMIDLGHDPLMVDTFIDMLRDEMKNSKKAKKEKAK